MNNTDFSSISRLPYRDNYPYSLKVYDSKAVLIGKTPFIKEYDYIDCEYIRGYTPEWYRNNYDDRFSNLGWDMGPSVLFDFIEKIRDDYYENQLDHIDEIPLFVHTTRVDSTNDSMYEEYCELYVCDSRGGEYIMWDSTDFYSDTGEVNSELIQKVLVVFSQVYEEPQVFLDKFGVRRYQLACDSVDRV